MPANSSIFDSTTMVTTDIQQQLPQQFQQQSPLGTSAAPRNTSTMYPDLSNPLDIQCAIQYYTQLQQQQSSLAGGLNMNYDISPPPGPASMLDSTEEQLKRTSSQNMTECVQVPSSEHVAEIVGRQGCKIKALRAKTNTYIKTPVRGEEPVFVVTGRLEDVTSAKREILSAADHFSQIRACRRNNMSGALAPGPPATQAGQVTISVRVPYRVVGLVVGPKGATIKRIQQQTQTYIVTPSRDKEPVFEVTGGPEAVEAAKTEIESHIALRTGTNFDDDALSAFALANNMTVDSIINSSELLAHYRNQQANPTALNQLGSSSLNAMLSTNSTGTDISAMYNTLYNLSNGTQTNSNTEFCSGTNGLNGLNLGGVNGTQLSGLHGVSNSNSNSFGLDLNCLNSINQTSSFGSFGTNGTLSGLSSTNGMSTTSNGLSTTSSGFSSTNGLSLASQLSNANFGVSTSSASGMNFDVLGETSNNLLNGTRTAGLETGVFSTLARSGGYTLDEGLGSLTSSMGSSPALEQPNSRAIWSSDPMASVINSLNLNAALTSGNNSPPDSASPTNSMKTTTSFIPQTPAQLCALSAALANLSANCPLSRSNSSSSEYLGFNNNPATSIVQSVLDSDVLANSSPLTTDAGQNKGAVTLSVGATEQLDSKRGGNDAKQSKTCSTCQKDPVVAAFIPCGHNQHCMACAAKLKAEGGDCPSCHTKIDRVIMIRS